MKSSKGLIIAGIIVALLIIGWFMRCTGLYKDDDYTKTSDNYKSNDRINENKPVQTTFKFKKGDVVTFNVGSESLYSALYSGLPKYVDYKEILSETKCLVGNSSNRLRIINDGIAFKRATGALDDSYKPVWYMVEDLDGDCGVGYVFEGVLKLSE